MSETTADSKKVDAFPEAMNGTDGSVAPEQPIADAKPSSKTMEEGTPTKKRKAPSDELNDSPVPISASKLPKIPKKLHEPGAHDRKQNRRTLKQGPKRTRRDSPPSRRRDTSPRPVSRSPSRSVSPRRELKRPGAASRIGAQDKEEARKKQFEREQNLRSQNRAVVAARGVGDVVTQYYNAVPERGREWRKTDSKIKGLRSFNNWIKNAIIQKFSPGEDHTPGMHSHSWSATSEREQGLLVLDIGCGKGGDLQKWSSAPQRVDLYVGIDPAEVSIDQAKERYAQMQRSRGPRHRPNHLFDARFIIKDAFAEWLGDLPIIQQVGIDPNVGPSVPAFAQRFGLGGFDVVSMMFCMHYAFENEVRARGMLRNVAGALKKGGRFLGVIPNSDVLSAKAEEFNKSDWEVNGKVAGALDELDDWDPEKSLDTPDLPRHPADEENKDEEGELQEEKTLEWGNGIYRVKFPGKTPSDGVFRPPFGWKYFYFMEEAVEEVPEYVVPWEAFRALAEDYNLELRYRKSFNEIWDEEKNDPILGPLSERMGVRDRGRGPLRVSAEELEAASFYHAFCFQKV